MASLMLRFFLYFQLAFYNTASSRDEDQCILLIPPDDEHCDVINEFLIEKKSRIIHLSSSEVYTAPISLVLEKDKYMCSEIIGVVGELDSLTARIFHTLANKSDLDITLVASSTPLSSLPVTSLALPDIFDINPIQHYIDATVSFVDRLNWTRIGLITDDTYYHLYAAEMLQKRLLQNSVKSIAPHLRITEIEDLNLQVFTEYGTQKLRLSFHWLRRN